MSSSPVNVLLSSFPGLALPPTLCIPLLSSTTITELTTKIASYLPFPLNENSSHFVLTTTNNQPLPFYSSATLATLLSGPDSHASDLLPLRLSARICGGKGGFGSQLRAAGGRMSSRRKGNQEANNGSNRNLDGRRVRTVNEAKALAEYLALKPEMDKKEKEVRRRRWEAIVEAAEKREQEIRNGEGKGKVDGAWMEDKEEMGEKAREAVLQAMKDGAWKDNLAGGVLHGGSESSGSGGSATPSEDSDMEDVDTNSAEASTSSSSVRKPPPTRRYAGFDDEDDDELMSDEEDEDEPQDPKGKAKA
ncbi:hypothetical protein FQN57_004490 [Myotisia sp. PD_48]|nr:hypothetical protein FQN57_004490 [Myotisia sp. PD_48]